MVLSLLAVTVEEPSDFGPEFGDFWTCRMKFLHVDDWYMVIPKGEPGSEMVAGRPIVVGVLDRQHAALSYGVSRAEQLGCELLVVHAYYVPQTTMHSEFSLDVAAGFEAAGKEVLAEARRFVESLSSTAPAHYLLICGHASPVLLEESARAAELVLGPDNSSWVSRLFEGLVSRLVVTGAGCPVVVVPERWTTSESRHGIILTIGDEPPAEGPLWYAFETAAYLNEPLRLLHVSSESTTELEKDLMRENVSRLLGGWQHRFPSVRVETTIVSGDVSSESMRQAKSARLIVAGHPHASHLRFILERPFAQTIIEGASCPVAIVPAYHSFSVTPAR